MFSATRWMSQGRVDTPVVRVETPRKIRIPREAPMNKRLLSAGLHLAEVGPLRAMALLLSPAGARAQGALVVYCSVEEEWCRAMASVFERQTGVRVAMTRKSAGETYAQVKAESANPRGDICGVARATRMF